MYLTSLRLKDFAGLASAALEGLDPGLNVVVGDNEAGKSTLLLALRAAFFQKHRASGEAARALAPYGRQVRPEIDVGFEIAGVPYRLGKAFLQKPDASLSWPGGEAKSDAVEDRLAELLGFAHPGSGAPKLDAHHGAFGLLWVEQGRSHEHDLNLGVGRNAVTASLEGEIGQILGGDRGRALLAAAKALQDRFFTASGRAVMSSPLKEAEETLSAQRAELMELQSARRDHEDRIDRLRSRREVLASYLRDDAVGTAERAVETAEADERKVAATEREHRDASRDLDHALASRAAAAERLSSRQRLEASLAAAEAARVAALGEEIDVAAADAAERAGIARQEASRDAARLALAGAETRDEAAAGTIERLRLAAEITALDKRLAEATELQARLSALLAADAAVRIDRRAVQALEAAQSAWREAEIRLGQAVPTLTFEPLEGRGIHDGDGKAVPAGTPLPILSHLTFALEGFGLLTVQPGDDASALRRAFDEATAHRDKLHARHGVESLDAARALLRTAEERRGEIALLRRQLETLLPEGADAAAEARSRSEAALSVIPIVEASTDSPLDPAALRRLRRQAQESLAAAETALDAARKTAAGFAARRARSQAEAEHRRATATALAEELAATERQRTKAALAEDLAAAELDRTAKSAVLDLRKRALEEADPETVARSLKARRRALDEIRRTVAGLKDAAAALEGELRAQGHMSLGEDIARVTGEIESLDARRKRLALEADAARLLHTTLLAAQREAREHWLGPIKAEVAPFLRLIHPESEVAFDETTLSITGLHRRGVEEEFKRLSAGAREQVAVVTRLALASVLKRGGHPALVILDDALVNTDERRLPRMHMVLQKAAETMQIIVLTCRERDFRDLGGKIFRL